MRIVLTFESFDEYMDHLTRFVQKYITVKTKEKKPASELVPLEDVVKVLESEAKKTVIAEEKVEKVEEKVETPKTDDAPAVDESFRLEVRKTLAKLNKIPGRKGAAVELIKQFGVSRLDEVALADLPALMQKAKEALDAE